MQDVRGVAQGPIWKEFLGWLGGFFQGDLGESYAHPGETVMAMVLRLPPRARHPPEKMIDLNKWLEAEATVDAVVIRMLQTAVVGILLYLLFARLSRRLPEPRSLFRAIAGLVLAGLAVESG